MEENAKKKIDENWKNQVNKDKQEAKEEQRAYHEPDFKIFISSLSMQAMIAMGKIQNPLTKKIEKNIDQARYLIDTLGIIENKTKGNLAKDEERILNDSLFNLRMVYIDEKEK